MKNLAILIFASALPCRIFADSLNLTTWYPAPYGVYSQLRSTGNSYFAYQGGNVGIGTTSPNFEGFGINERVLTISGATGGDNRGAIELNNPSPGTSSQIGRLEFLGAGTVNASIQAINQGAPNSSVFAFSTRDAAAGFTEKMRITNVGNVGIGTTNPQSKLHIAGDSGSGGSNAAAIRLEDTRSTTPHVFRMAVDGNSFILTDLTAGYNAHRLWIDSAGRFGIGTTTPGANLDVTNGGNTNGGTVGRMMGYGGNMGTNNIVLDLEANVASSGGDTILNLKHTNVNAQGGYGYLMYGTAGISGLHRDAMIDLHGNMGLGSNGNVGPGNGLMYRLQLFNCPGGGGDAQWGCAAKADGTTWINASDARLKDVQGDYRRGLSEIARLQPVRFRYQKGNSLGLPSEKEFIGFTAQQVQKSIPEAVFEGPDGYLRFNADPVFWAMLNAIRELKAKNEILESRLQALESRLGTQAKNGDAKPNEPGTLR